MSCVKLSSTLISIMLIVGLAAPASADTFNPDGTCVTDAGDPGFWSADETCITAQVFDEVMSAEALSEVPSLTIDGASVTEVYDLQDTPVASERPLGVGLVDDPVSYKQLLSGVQVT